MRSLRALTVVAALVATVLGTWKEPAPAVAGTTNLRISVLSNRADLISAGDALVAVELPSDVAARDVRMSIGKRDVTGAFAMRPDGRFEGLVTGLPLGDSVLQAKVRGYVDQVTITNHPNGGPVFSGPQLKPWLCQPSAVDAQCNQPVDYSFLYKSIDPTKVGLQPFDVGNPPTDIATTTTDQGITVPFVVRVETGYADRDQYKILTLFEPGKAWQPWAPQRQWNHKLLINLGSDCQAHYQSGDAPLIDYGGLFPATPATQPSHLTALGRGFAVLSTSLANNGKTCGNLPLEAESLVMGKERLVEAYGPVRYTIGTGCSGGALVPQQVANAYPGIFQGLTVQCSYPDAWSTATQFIDYHLLRRYFENPLAWGLGVLWSPTQWSQVEGHLSPTNAIAIDEAQFPVIRPTYACPGISDARRYEPTTNPSGVRCGLADFNLNAFGPRPQSAWGLQETRAGRGFAGLPLDNVGVQYGLGALRKGQILPGQFLDLNAKIGGLDVDLEPTAKRMVADPSALANAYRTGSINSANNLDQVAIIDGRGPDPTLLHDAVRAFWTRARLDREHGTHDNQAIWEGPFPIIGDLGVANNSLLAMDRWLSAVEADHSDRSLPAKIIADRPADAGDSCWDGAGQKVSDGLCPDPVVPVYSTPRMVAGDGMTADTNKCQLTPLDRTADYGPIPFSDAQWAQLQKIFPDGVCDFTRPPVTFGPTVPWQAYQTAQGGAVYGGQPLPPAPLSSGTGWTSPAFRPND